MSDLSNGVGIRSREDIGWCSFDGRPSLPAIQKPLSFISDVKDGRVKASAENVIFRDTKSFLAGELHHHYDTWRLFAGRL